jgi:hypothetical protein
MESDAEMGSFQWFGELSFAVTRGYGQDYIAPIYFFAEAIRRRLARTPQ